MHVHAHTHIDINVYTQREREKEMYLGKLTIALERLRECRRKNSEGYQKNDAEAMEDRRRRRRRHLLFRKPNVGATKSNSYQSNESSQINQIISLRECTRSAIHHRHNSQIR